MKFLRLPDPLLSVLHQDDDIIAIDKPYGFNAHTNDSKIELSEFIQDGLIEIYEKQLGQKLHIIHRLDQTTTGVMIFGKSVESAKKYAEYFFNRQVQKTYLFITKSVSTKPHFFIDQNIVHKAKDLEASTDLIFSKKTKNYELWIAKPHTGRNHQIRIHVKAAQIPILGDDKYDGSKYPFLCLHNSCMEFPNGLVLNSQPPKYFDDLNILEDKVLAQIIFETDRRRRLFATASESQCFRLLHLQNNSNSTEFTIDQFGQVVVLNWYKEKWGQSDYSLFELFSNYINKPILIKTKTAQLEDQTVIYPTNNIQKNNDSWLVQENNIKYTLKNNIGTNVGLFLNQRLQRNWILENSKNKNVLNLFAHTSTYGVAAALGGARHVISVEMGKNNLNLSKECFLLNGLDIEQNKFLCRDSVTYLDQCKAKLNKFDLIICDTPSFYRREKSLFKIEEHIESLLENVFQCLEKNGQFLFSTNYDSFFINDIRNIILKVLRKLQIQSFELSCILPSLDFELPDEKANLKSFLVQISPVKDK